MGTFQSKRAIEQRTAALYKNNMRKRKTGRTSSVDVIMSNGEVGVPCADDEVSTITDLPPLEEDLRQEDAVMENAESEDAPSEVYEQVKIEEVLPTIHLDTGINLAHDDTDSSGSSSDIYDSENDYSPEVVSSTSSDDTDYLPGFGEEESSAVAVQRS